MSREGLKRSLGLFPATNIVVANMIGAGIFTTSGLIMAQLNHPLLMLGLWVVGGIIALCGALSYGELGANIPKAGGEYQFLRELYHPMLGFLSGWVSFTVGFSAPIAASAMGFSEYVLRAFPAGFSPTDTGGGWSPELIKNLLSVSVILLFTLIHYRGLKVGAGVQNVLTLLKILLIVALLAAGIFSHQGDTGHFASAGPISTSFSSWKAMGLALMWIMFAYSGWNASTYIGAEIRSPSRNLPGSLLIGTAIVLILYIGLNALFIYSIPGEEMKGVVSIGGLAMKYLFGRPAEMLFSLLIGFALFSSLSAFIIIGPRVYYSMAKDGLFFRSVARIHPRFMVPSNAILLQSAIAIVMVLSGTFEQILTYMGFALGIFPILTVLAVFRLRKRRPSAVRLKGFPVAQVIYSTFGILILILAYLERPAESSIALLTVLLGVPAYFYFRRNIKQGER
jgi:APA family basic amino acid/polyamine antiporter